MYFPILLIVSAIDKEMETLKKCNLMIPGGDAKSWGKTSQTQGINKKWQQKYFNNVLNTLVELENL